jgi:hypothetical protein
MLQAEPPHNVGYMVAAYVVAPVSLVGYLMSLLRRARRPSCTRPIAFSSYRLFVLPPYVVLCRGGSNTCSQSSAATIPPRIGPTQ